MPPQQAGHEECLLQLGITIQTIPQVRDECISYRNFTYLIYAFSLFFSIHLLYFDATLGICAYLCMLTGLGAKEQDLEWIQFEKRTAKFHKEKHGLRS